MDFVYLVANLCTAWTDGRKASEEELKALKAAARGAGGADLVSAIEVLAEHGNELVSLRREALSKNP